MNLPQIDEAIHEAEGTLRDAVRRHQEANTALEELEQLLAYIQPSEALNSDLHGFRRACGIWRSKQTKATEELDSLRISRVVEKERLESEIRASLALEKRNIAREIRVCFVDLFLSGDALSDCLGLGRQDAQRLLYTHGKPIYDEWCEVLKLAQELFDLGGSGADYVEQMFFQPNWQLAISEISGEDLDQAADRFRGRDPDPIKDPESDSLPTPRLPAEDITSDEPDALLSAIALANQEARDTENKQW